MPDLDDLTEILSDPIRFTSLCFPHIKLYDKQVELLRSVQINDETVVPAGNDLGKDFTAGLCAIWFLCSRSPCRVVTLSSGQTQLKSVLWGEIANFIRTSEYPLPLEINDLWIRQRLPDGSLEPKSYLRGIVTVDPENLQGHHLPWGKNQTPRTLAILDEASGIDTVYYNAVDTWTHRKLIIGNPLPCENFFKAAVKGGDVKAEHNGHYHRKIIRIQATDSPNVRFAELEISQGKEPSYKELVPGVLNYREYQKRLKLWDKIRQCIGLRGQFYEGSEVLLYPPEWLDRAEQVAAQLLGVPRQGKRTMGVDTAEGGDSTVWTVIDMLGILHQLSLKTTDTAEIPGQTIQLMRQFRVKAEDVLFDRGGGGKQHVDQLRKAGHHVRSVAFGEAATTPIQKSSTSFVPAVKWQDDKETKYVYKNRRAEMFGMIRFLLLDPNTNPQGFGIPAELTELRRQLSPIPLKFDGEGRLYLPPKNKKNPDSHEVTLIDILGCSPDEADSLSLAVFGLFTKPTTRTLGELF